MGEAIKESGIDRKELFITTKLWNQDMRDHTQRENIEKSLEYLQTDYLDLLLIHWPVAGVYKESWKIMEEFYKEGKIRAIGVSNFQIHHLDDLLRDAEVVPAVNQIECHPYLTQKQLFDYCDQKGIAVEAGAPWEAVRHRLRTERPCGQRNRRPLREVRRPADHPLAFAAGYYRDSKIRS